MAFVAIKIGRRQSGASRTGTRRARISNDMQPPSNAAAGLFSSQPFGRGRLAVFLVARSPRINSDMLVARALKNSQLTRPWPGEGHGISGTGHY
jgi:hypothetical protein